jgi:hypothetical protein
MKRVLIISYDLVSPEKNYEKLLKLIKAYPSWAKLGGSSYLIYTASTPVQVRDRLKRVLNRSDKLYVGVAPAPSAWMGMPEGVSKWIREHQK